jgi:hypothetical protein
MIYVGIACVVLFLFLLFCYVLCAQTRNADEVMMQAYKEMMEERARKEGGRQITPRVEEGPPGIGDPIESGEKPGPPGPGDQP